MRAEVVAITGATGRVGGWVVARLADAGVPVVALARDADRRRDRPAVRSGDPRRPPHRPRRGRRAPVVVLRLRVDDAVDHRGPLRTLTTPGFEARPRAASHLNQRRRWLAPRPAASPSLPLV